MRAQPADKKLYEIVKKEAKKRFKVWPSAYASGWLVREYKRRGGTYLDEEEKKKKIKRSEPTDLERWYLEKWIDVCRLPRIVPCGRNKAVWSDYPYCRPSKRINDKTPTIATELTQKEIRERCARKKYNPKIRIVP